MIGLISGTSIDAIEASAADLCLEGEVITARLLGHRSAPYSREITAALNELLPPQQTTIGQIAALDADIGRAFGRLAREAMHELCEDRVDLICSHGQTVFHAIDPSGQATSSLQLGNPAYIAEITGASVVSDFRSRDIAAGGQGAPLVSLADTLLLGRDPPVVSGVLNLGGIANVTVLEKGEEPLAYDVGPGNVLIDAAVRLTSNGTLGFDAGGAAAARGTVDPELLESLARDPYYGRRPPKSTGREHFHLEYLRAHLGDRLLSPDDLVATVTALSATTVARALGSHHVRRVIASGGGTRNATLIQWIERELGGLRVELSDTLGLPEAEKEAFAFGLIGFLSVQAIPATLPSCTGARHTSVLGSITPGVLPLSLTHRAVEPKRLVIEN